MRITPGSNRMIELPGAWATDAVFGANGVALTAAPEPRKPLCSGCGDIYELVPWTQAGSPYTRGFEDMTAPLARQ